MSFDFRKVDRKKMLAAPVLDSFGNPQRTADYMTLAEAFADIATWDVLEIAVGTFLFSQLTLPAGKSIVGLDRDLSIIQTTYDVAGGAALSMGHESTLRNLWVRGATAGVNRINLLDFAGAAAGQHINLDNVRIDRGGGNQNYKVYAPVRASQCWFELSVNSTAGTHWCIGLKGVASVLTNCRFTYTINSGTRVFAPESALTLNACTFDNTGGNSNFYVIIPSAAGADVSMVGCTFTGVGYIFWTQSTSTIRIAGCNLGAYQLWTDTVNLTLYMIGNTGYIGTNALSSGTIKQMDFGLARTVAATPTTLVGWENFAYVNNAAATVVNLPSCARFGVPHLLIIDSGGNANRYPITVNCQGTDTFYDGTTTRRIQEKWGWLLLAKNEGTAPDTWDVIASSKPEAPAFRGLLTTYGFTERGWAEPNGGVSLQGRALLGNITSVSAGASSYGVNANGGYLLQTVTGAANDRVYSHTAAPTGPFSGAADWDVSIRFASVAAHNDIRQAYGVIDAAVITDALDAADPDHPYCLVQKISGAATARLAVRTNTAAGGGVQTVTNFATWTPAADTFYQIVIRKRGTTFTAFVYSNAGLLLDSAVVSGVTILATSALRWFSGLKDTSGAAGRDLKQYGSADGQQYSALGL